MFINVVERFGSHPSLFLFSLGSDANILPGILLKFQVDQLFLLNLINERGIDVEWMWNGKSRHLMPEFASWQLLMHWIGMYWQAPTNLP